MDKFTDEVTHLTILPNRVGYVVNFPARGGRDRYYFLTPATAIFQAGAVMRLEDVAAWVMVGDDTAYHPVVCEVEYEGTRAAVAKFDRK